MHYKVLTEAYMHYNIYPLYICGFDRPCSKSEGCVLNDGPCSNTTCAAFAKNMESVDIYNKFFDTFDAIYEEETGAIIGYKEKEQKDGLSGV